MTAPAAEAETLATIVQSLTTQLAVAHGRIQELQGQLSGALKELEMNEQMMEVKLQHAVLIAQTVWNEQWQLSEAQVPSYAAELQPAPPADAPAVSRFPELRVVEVDVDPLPDPWRPVAAPPPGIANQAEDAAVQLRQPHPKDFTAPTQYAGGVESWAAWSKRFKQHVGIRQPHWLMLLGAVENIQGRPVTPQDEAQWAKELRLADIQDWKLQLNMYLEQHTTGSIKSEVVEIYGKERALDAWRIMAERGNSQSPETLQERLSKIIHPKKSAASKDVEREIAVWERDIEIYRSSKPGYIMDADQRLMLLKQLCPTSLQQYLRLKADDVKDYEKLKTIIHDWLRYPENNPPPRTGKIAALEQVTEDADWEKEDGEQNADVHEEVMTKCDECDPS